MKPETSNMSNFFGGEKDSYGQGYRDGYDERQQTIDEQSEEISSLHQRIADLELEVAGQQKIIEENMGLGSIVEDKRK